MNLILFARSLNAGGAERQLVLLANGLAERGHAVTVLLLHGGGALLPLLSSRVALLSTDKKGRWDVVRPLWRLWRLFRSPRAEAIYAMLPMQTAIAALLAPRKAKVIFGLRASLMTLEQYDWLSALAYRLEAWLAWRADAIIANADAIRQQPPSGMDPRRIAVVPNGIDTEAFQPDPAGRRRLRAAWGIAEDAPLIGTVARLDPMKDHENFLRAAQILIRDLPSARFVCVGDGAQTYRQTMVERAGALNLADKVIWAGERRDLAAIYSALDILAVTSAFGEGFPNVAGEAMACGTPVVATDIGDTRAILATLGTIVPARDAEALARGWLAMWHRLRAERTALGAAARARIIADFSVATMVSRTEQCLREALNGRSATEIARQIDAR